MIDWKAIRAWAGVHATVPAVGVLLTVAVGSLLFGQSTVQDFGLVRLVAPVSVLLLLPAVAGMAAALGCENMARLALPTPARAVVARVGWAIGWTAAAMIAVGATSVVSSTAPSLMAIARNVALNSAIALTVVWLGAPQLVWLPGLAYMICAMTFGYPVHKGHEYFWWAVAMKEEVTVSQGVWVGASLAISVATYARGRRGQATSTVLSRLGRR